LWILERLAGIDKHRHLLLTGIAYDRLTFIIEGKRREGDILPQPITLEKNTEVANISFDPSSKQVEMDVDITMTVALGKTEPGGGDALCPLLRRLLERVRDEIVPAFDRFRDGIEPAT
jgi:hypothetical protein